MSWQEIRGQQDALSFLKNVLREGKFSGGYLFVGPQGVGKTLSAKNFAKAINCLNRSGKLDCCDQCPSCLKIDSFNHPDVSWIETAENARKISIDQIRNIKKEIVLKPYEAKTKVYVILRTELLTEEAANSLLKTLEEPPANALLILTTSQMRKLLPTIISRCKIVKFSSLPTTEVEEVLKNSFQQTPQSASFLANLCEGRLGKAIELTDRDILRERDEIINQLPDTQSREEIKEQLRILLSWYRDILVSKCETPSLSLINADRATEVLNQAKEISFEKATRAIKAIIRTYTFIEQNANTKLALDVMTGELKNV